MSTEPNRFFSALQKHFVEQAPHIKALGVVVELVSAPLCRVCLPYQPFMLADVERGRLHTGVMTSLIDSACGLAAVASVGHPTSVATLDLRVDYLASAQAGLDLVCEASCYRMTRSIAFLRAKVWQQPGQILAESMGSFVITALPARAPKA